MVFRDALKRENAEVRFEQCYAAFAQYPWRNDIEIMNVDGEYCVVLGKYNKEENAQSRLGQITDAPMDMNIMSDLNIFRVERKFME